MPPMLLLLLRVAWRVTGVSSGRLHSTKLLGHGSSRTGRLLLTQAYCMLFSAGITEPVRLDANDNGVRIGLGRQEVRTPAWPDDPHTRVVGQS